MSEQYKIDGRPSTIFRVVHNQDNPYVVINKTAIENPALSFKAKGILTYLMSRPDGWEVSVSDLMKRSIDKEWSVRSGLKELRDARHMRYTNSRDQGRITRWIIEIYEVPQDTSIQDSPTDEILEEGVSPDIGNLNVDTPIDGGSPDRGFLHEGNPQVGNPHVGNQGQVLSTLSNNDSNSNDLSIKRARAKIFGIEASILQDRSTVVEDLQVVKKGWADGIPEPELELLRVFTQVTGIFPEKSDKGTWCAEAHRWLSLTPPAQPCDIEEAYHRAKPDNGKGYHVYHPRSLTGGIKETIGERIRGATKPKTPHDKLKEA